METNLLNQSSNTTLARLMSQENIRVEFQPDAETASFNVKDRILILPQYTNMTENEMALFVAHEVSHALNTNWKRYSDVISKVKKDFNLTMESAAMLANIVEDVRIEKHIKRRYPGTKKDFYLGYKDLKERLFKKKEDKVTAKSGFIGRFNHHFKFGFFEPLAFSPEEQALVDDANNMETMDDLESVCVSIAKYYKENNMMSQSKSGSGENTIDGEEGTECGFVKWGAEGENPGNPKSGGKSGKDAGKSAAGKKPASKSSGKDDNKDPGSPNQNNPDFATGFGGGVYDHSKGEPNLYIDSPIISNFKNMVVPVSKVKKAAALETSSLQKFITSINPAINLMASIFNRKKRATNYQKTQTSKTGNVDLKKMVNYKFQEDVFRTTNVTPTGKKHGMVIYIDWSGSMSGNIKGTVSQLVMLCQFCRRINIPFEVFAFSNAESSPATPRVSNAGGAYVNPVTLINFVSSKLPAAKYNESIANLWTHGVKLSGGYGSSGSVPYGLGGTPLNEAAFHAFNYIPAFKKENSLDIVNLVFLTDGGAENTIMNQGRSYSRNVILRHRYATFKAEQDHGTDAIMRCIRDTYGCNALCFYIESMRSASLRRNKDAQGYTAHYSIDSTVMNSHKLGQELLTNKDSRSLLDEITTYFC